MAKTIETENGPEAIFDSVGNALRLTRSELARRLGQQASGRDPVDYAVRQLGFVRVEMTGRTVVVDFSPATAKQLAVIASFYEIAGHEFAGLGLTKFVLMCRGEPDRFETYSFFMNAFRRIEALIKHTP